MKQVRSGITLKLLAVIAPLIVLFVASLCLGFYTIFRTKGVATEINFAGQLRYRSYQMAWLLGDYATLQGEARQKAGAAILGKLGEFEGVVYGLRDGNKALGLKGMKAPKEIEDCIANYDNPWCQLDRHIQHYQDAIKPMVVRILETPDPAVVIGDLRALNKQIPIFVADIDRTVGLLAEVLKSDTAKGKVGDVVNFAGQLRYRSYQLAALLNAYPTASGDERYTARSTIQKKMKEFEQMAYGLRDGNPTMGLDGLKLLSGGETASDHNDPYLQMDRHIKDYEDKIKPLALHILDAPDPAETAMALNAYNAKVPFFITDIDRTVRLLAQVSEKRIATFNRVEFALLGIFLGVAIGSFFLAVVSVRRPVFALLRGAEAFGRGVLSYRVPVRGRDEFGALADSFNAMAERISGNIKEMEETHSRQMKTVSHLSNGIAHHLNNPLTGIGMYVEILLKKTEAFKDMPIYGEFKDYLGRLEDAARRCETVMGDLLSISRISNPTKSPLAVHNLVRGVLREKDDQLKSLGILVVEEIPPETPRVLGNQGHLMSALVSLVSNALDAMPTGGTLSIGAKHLMEHGKVQIAVSDTGPAISKKDLSHIFDPYFILKIRPSGRVTGLEMALAKLAVQAQGGTIEAESEEGRGTTVRVKLPVCQEQGTVQLQGMGAKG